MKLYRLNADHLPTRRLHSTTRTAERDLVRQWSQPIEAPLNKINATRLDLAEGGGRLTPGLYLLDVNSPQIDQAGPTELSLQSTARSGGQQPQLTLKSRPNEALVWATDYQSGQPVSGVPLTFYDYNGRNLGTATTDAQGVARVKYDSSSTQIIGALSTEPFAAMFVRMEQLASPLRFWFEAAAIRAMAVTIQRLRLHRSTDLSPGQAVDFKGIIRAENDVKYSLPDVRRVHVQIQQPQWRNRV